MVITLDPPYLTFVQISTLRTLLREDVTVDGFTTTCTAYTHIFVSVVRSGHLNCFYSYSYLCASVLFNSQCVFSLNGLQFLLCCSVTVRLT